MISVDYGDFSLECTVLAVLMTPSYKYLWTSLILVFRRPGIRTHRNGEYT